MRLYASTIRIVFNLNIRPIQNTSIAFLNLESDLDEGVMCIQVFAVS